MARASLGQGLPMLTFSTMWPSLGDSQSTRSSSVDDTRRMQSPTAAVGGTTGAVDEVEPVPWEAANAVNTKMPPSTTITTSHGTARKITDHTPASGATSTSSLWNRGA